MSSNEQYPVGEHVAGFKVDAVGRTVAEIADELAGGKDSDRYGVVWDVLGEPLFNKLPDKEIESPREIKDAVDALLSNSKQRIRVVGELRDRLVSDPDALKEFILTGEGSAEEVAKLIAGIRVAYQRATGDDSVISNVRGLDKEEQDKETEDAATVQDTLMALAGSLSAQAGGGEGLSFNDPAYDLKMFAVATKRIVEDLAGVDRERMNLPERADWVRQAAIWFISNGLLRRYISTLANETTGSFEWATYVDLMVQGVPKADAMWQKLEKTISGGSQEIGGLGAEMADGAEVDAMIHNLGVEYRVIQEDGKELVVKHSLERMFNFYRGDFPKEGQKVEQLSMDELKELFKKYGGVISEKYVDKNGQKIDPLRVWAKANRIKYYRRDLDFVRIDVPHDMKFKEGGVRRGEKLSEAEQKFYDEVLKQPMFVSEKNSYVVGEMGAQVTLNKGEIILPAFLGAEEVKKLQNDPTALYKFLDHSNPFNGPLMPAWAWATRALGNTKDVGADEYIKWELAEAGVDMDKVVAIELPRKRSGAFRTMETIVGGRSGGVSSYDVGLLSSGGLARLGEKNSPYLKQLLYEEDGETIVRDSYGNVMLAPKKDNNGNPLYQPKINHETGEVKRDENGNVVFQELIGLDGKVVVDSKGRVQYRPKLDDSGKEQYELVRDEDGSPIPVDPREIMVKNVAGVSLSPIYKAMRGIWFGSGLVDADPINAGQLTPKGILKGLEWKLYCWYYGITYPYGEDFLETDKDDLLYRSRGSNAMWVSGDEDKAADFVVRHTNPLHGDNDALHTLAPYELAPDEREEIRSVRKDINNRLASLEEGRSLSRGDLDLIKRHTDQGEWIKIGQKVYSAREYQSLEIKMLLEHSRYLPSDIASLYIMQNHLQRESVELWKNEMSRQMPGKTILGVTEEVANRLLEKYEQNFDVSSLGLKWKEKDDGKNLLRFVKKPKTTEELELRQRFISDMDKELRREFAGVTQKVDEGLSSLADSYLAEKIDDLEGQSPVGRMGTVRQMLWRIKGFTEVNAKLFETFECRENLASMGVDVESMPEWMTQGRVGLMNWVMQMGIDKFNFDDFRDKYTADWDYNGKEGDIQQQIWSPLLTAFTRTSVAPNIKAQFGTDRQKIRDMDDLIYQVIEMTRGGMKREEIDKMAAEIAEGYIKAWQKMSFRGAGGEREKIFVAKLIDGLDLMFPTVRSARFKLERRGLGELQEFIPGVTAWDMPIAEPGRIGDQKKLIKLKVGKNGFGVGPDQVLINTVQKKGLGVGFISHENKHKAALLSDAFQIGYEIFMNSSGETSPAIVDPLMVFGSEAPQLTYDKNGNKVNQAKRLFATWLVQIMLDQNALTLEEKSEIMGLLP